MDQYNSDNVATDNESRRHAPINYAERYMYVLFVFKCGLEDQFQILNL